MKKNIEMKIIINKLADGDEMKWYNGNVIKKLLKTGDYQVQLNDKYIKNTITGDILHYNRIMRKTVIN